MGNNSNKLEEEQLAGALVFAQKDQKIHLALLKDFTYKWTLPKGHINDNEKEKAAAKREVKEELGLDVTILHKIDEFDYLASPPDGNQTMKHVVYFLAQAEYGPLQIGKSKGLREAKWYAIEEVQKLLIYREIREIISAGLVYINKHYSKA